MQHRGHYAWKKETSEYLIPTEVQPAFEPAVEARVHGVQQEETAATSTLAHVQQFAVASTTAKEITHDDVEMVRRFVLRAAAVRRDGR